MIRIAHISDPHLGPLPTIARRSLGLKQRLGHLNWIRNRAHAYDDSVLSALVADMQSGHPDHIAVTGDLINLGLSAEVEGARQWLDGLGSPETISVVPGNHDAYTTDSDAFTRSRWAPFMRGDDVHEVAPEARFPYLRRRGDVALIGVSTAIATAPLMATGRVGDAQLSALAALLQATGEENLCRLVM
ncbi:MAG: metallophosphoesterase family protein, partial [Alphaproteobacteria bacterium]